MIPFVCAFRSAGLFALALLVWCAPLTAFAQAEQTWSVHEYQQLRQDFDDADRAVESAAPRTDERDATTEALVRRAEELIGYLNGWLASDGIEAGVANQGRAQRFVLFENLVKLQADLGRCEASRSAAIALAALAQTSGVDDAQSLVDSADVVAGDCEYWAPGPVNERMVVVRRSTVRPPAAAWPLLGTGIAVLTTSLAIEALALNERREFGDLRESQRAEWRIEDDARLRELRRPLRRQRSAAIGLAVVGSVAAAAGITALWVHRSEQPRVEVTASVTGVAIGW
ncbi:MAG: hypothetical protein ACI82G_000327 [Bradymonadia bacterium]|jgi:hypothetical protein